jgi:hypothetical protein
MTTILANAGTAAQARGVHFRLRWVESLVTVAILAWFGAVLATMVGEWQAAPAVPPAPMAAKADPPVPAWRAATLPQKSAHVTMSLI